MQHIRRSNERGGADHGWLKSHHTFSFADYYDRNFMGFRSLRVINEDYVDGETGFGKHPHKDMEIITYVISGELQHQDTMGNREIIRPGEVQKMSAGTGVQHSETNPGAVPVHLLQIWIMPSKTGIAPNYDQKSFDEQLKTKNLVLAVSPDGRDGSITIQQDAEMYLSRMKADESLEYKVRAGRGVWLQVIKGSLKLGSEGELSAGDGLAIEDVASFSIKALEPSEFILFDLK